MSSSLSVVGGAGIVAYVGSKHAIIGMTKTTAVEVGGRGIRVNAAAPGPIAGTTTFKLAEQASRATTRRSRRLFPSAAMKRLTM
ncbi:SDR family oxidoreductase [Rhizobium sp. P32RR-XVIII]|nr:SDR family NAD(P)-dependent oxidoreductase [Rhizobium sp. P32RR-XVIII]NLS07567.1 SDR family oxidoreductase [Rhizobium sp. P32RR-XVIII]